MREELMRDLAAMEEIMIRAAETRQAEGQTKAAIVSHNTTWWLAKAIYDLLKWAARKEKNDHD